MCLWKFIKLYEPVMSEQPDPIRILHVDDEPHFTELVTTSLEQEDERFEIESATSASEGLERLGDAEFDCVVSDHDMPGQSSIEFLTAVRDEYPDLPFILFTGEGSEEIASEAISTGVTEYLQKGTGTDRFTVLANRIRNLVERYRAEREAERTRSRLEAITNNSNDAIVTIDTDSVVRFANTAVEELFGYPPDRLTGESLTEIVPPRYREEYADAVRRYLRAGERTVDWNAVEFPARHRDGHEIPVSVSFSEFEEDGQQRFVGIIRDVSDRVRMEEELRERERRFRQMAENIQEVVWMSDPEREEVFYANPAYEELWGHSVEALYDDPTAFLDAIHPEDRDRVETALTTQPTVGYDETYRVVQPDGAVRWVRDRAVPVENDAGEVYRIVGVASDITEHKEREQEHERALDLLDQTEAIADVGGWEIDTETQEVFWTDHLFEMLGADYDEEPPLEEALDVYVEEDRPRVEQAVQEALAAGEPFDVEARFERPDGERRWFRIRGEPKTEGGEVVTLRGAVQDVTDHKEREAELERIQQFFTEAERLGDLGAWEFHVDGDVVWTDGTRRIHEVDMAYEPTLEEGLAFYHPEDRDRLEDAVERALDADLPYELELRLITAEGDERWVRTHGEPVEGTEGTVRGFIQDITDRKRREQQLERQNDRLDEFASVVSHDLRTPLSVAAGRLELAREECESAHLDPIDDALGRINTIVDDVLRLAREGQDIGTTEMVALQPVVEGAWAIVADDQAEAELILADDPDSWDPIRADGDRVRQLLENLFRNAIDHAGPDVTVRFETTDAGFAVEDDGPGIPEAERERIFESGYSLAEEGIGFGLSIVEQVVDAHGWEISVTDGAEGGARFEITGVDATAA
jgi:PAS domain S-box-containing protein